MHSPRAGSLSVSRRALRLGLGVLGVAAGVLACSGIITGPDAPDTRPRSMRVAPAQMQLALADTASLTATLHDVTGAPAAVEPGQHLRYVSLDTGIARVDSLTGLVTAIGDGTVTVRAEYGALTLGIPVTVLARPRLTIVGGNAQSAEQGDTLPGTLRVRALDALNQPLVGAVVTFTVTSGGGAVLGQVDTTDAAGDADAGWVLGLGLGAQSVAVRSPSVDSVAFTATATPGTRAIRVAITAPRTTLAGAGDTTRMSAVVLNVANVVLPAATVAWTSSVLAIATVSPTGLVTAVSPGTTYIGAISGNARDSVLVNVVLPPGISVTPDSVAFTAPYGTSPATAFVQLANTGSGAVTGITAGIAYGAGASGWLDVALDSTTLPLSMPITASTSTLLPGAYTATITIASTTPGVASRAIHVTLSVTGVVAMPKLSLGGDRPHPAWLQGGATVTLPATTDTTLPVTIRSLDISSVRVTAQQYAVGAASRVVQVEGGTNEGQFWIQGMEGAAGRTVTLIAEAAGFEPDTMVVTLTRPMFRLTAAGALSVPAVGGADPVLLLSVGDTVAGAFVPLAVSMGSEAPTFTLTSLAPAIAQLQMIVGLGVIGGNQGPATQVGLGIEGGTNTTSSGQFAGSPANIILVRAGLAGVVQVTAAGSTDFDAYAASVTHTFTAAAVPVIVVAPDSIALAAAAGAAGSVAQPVAITNGGGGTLSGLDFDVQYGAGASDWIQVVFDSLTAPTSANVIADPEFLAPGTYTATLIITSDVPGVAPVNVPVVFTVTGVPRIVIVSGDGQVVRWGQFAADSLKVRVLNANGTPVGDSFVSFTISANGGIMSPTSETTDNDGYVATRWMAGDSLGAYTVTASRSGFTSAVFNVTVVAGTFVTRVQITAPRTTLNNAADTEQFSAAAFNRADSLIASATITWASRTPSVVDVDPTGFVAAVAPGQAWIIASSDDGIDSVLVTVNGPPPCDVGFGGATVTGGPPTISGQFCPQSSTAPSPPNGDGNVNATWVETFGYGGGAYFESLLVSYNPTTGAVFEASYYLNDPSRSLRWGCSVLAFAPPPCTGVTVDILARTVTFANVLLGVGDTVRMNGTFPIATPPTPVIGVAPDSLGFTATVGDTTGTAQSVTVSNVGPGTLSGLAATVLYDAGASDWLSVSLDAVIPATLAVTPLPAFLAAGTYRALVEISSSVPGVVPETVVVRITVTAPLVVGLVKVAGDLQSAVVAQAIGTPLQVRLTDSSGAPISGAPVRWQAIYGCCNPIVDTTIATGADGRAFLSFIMPTVALPVTVTVSSTGQPGSPQVFNLTNVADDAVALAFTLNTGGGDAGVPVQPGWRVVARDQYANVDSSFTGPVTVALSNGPAFATLGGTTSKSAVSGIADFADLTVNVANSSWVLLATSPGLTSSASAAFSIRIPVALSLVNTPLVGVNGTATMRAVLGVPAYGAGLTVALVSNNTGVLVVNAPASVLVPAGQTTADFTVTGVSTGTVFVDATVDGASGAQTAVTVSTNTISVPLTLNLPYTRTASLPINLPAPAPAGGITIAITSANPSIVSVLTPTVFIPQGGVSGNAQLEGLALGQAAVTATGPNLATGTSAVTVTAALDLIETNVTINAGFSTASLTTRLLSGGAVFAAPVGGIPLTFVSRNPTCVDAPTNVSVAAGLNSVTIVAGYAGGASTPCIADLVVSSPSFDVDSVRITVNPPPTTSFSLTQNVAAGLSRDGILFLGAAVPAGGATVTITSSDPARLVVSPNSTTPGGASAQIALAPGVGYTYFTYAAIEGQSGTADLTATITNYQSPAPMTITLDPLGIEAGGTTAFTMPGADGSGSVAVGSLTAAGPSQSVVGSTIVRAGGQPVVVTLTSTTPAAVLPVVGGIAASPATVTINPGQASASFGLRPLAAGTSTITATSPSAASPARPGYPATMTVTQAGTSFSVTQNVAAGLSRDGILFLGAAAPAGGTVITLTSSDPARLVLAPNSSTVGTASVDITVPAGSGYSYFTYAAIEGQAGPAAVTISGAVQGAPPAYSNPTPVAITIDTLGLEASGSTSFTMPGTDGGGSVSIGSLGPAGPSQSVSGSTMVRAGGQPIVVTLTSTTPATVVPVVGGIAASPAIVTINPGQTSASYGLRPLAAGTSTLTATSPSAVAPVRPGYPATITVTQASTSFSLTQNVAAGLSRDGILFLGAGAPAGGTVITLTSSDPSRLVLARNATTVGTGSIDITIPAGSGYSYFTYAAIEGQAGAAPVTISGAVQGAPPAYTNPTPIAITIDPLGVELSGSTTLTTLGADGGGTVNVGSLSPAGPSQSVYGSTIIRAGGQPIDITLISTTPSVAVPVVGGIAASPRTVSILPGQASANYGLRPLVAGTTTITATSASAVTPVRPGYPATLTVTSPSSSISISPAVGAGLTMDGIVFLGVAAPAGGVTVTLTSSDPARLLLAPNATTAGAAQISIALPQGTGYTYFTVMGLEDVTGNPTVTAQTPGYTDAAASIAVQPIGVQFSGPAALTTLAADGGGTVAVGIISGVAGNRTVSPSQPIRYGGVARTITMTSSNAGVALPVVGGVAQQGITVTLLPGASGAPVNVRPIGVGAATIAPTGPGLIPADAPGNPPQVTVTVPNMTLSIPTMTQGAGLSQDAIVFLQTGVPAGGRTLTLTSNDPTRLLLAPNSTTTGAAQITFDLAAATGYTYFTVMGLEGAVGAATVTASMAGYRDTTFALTVVQPAVTLDGPAPTRTISQGDIEFHAQVGVPSGNGVQAQVVRYGAPGALSVTLTSSAPTIGTVVVDGVASSPNTVVIPIGASTSSTLVNARANFRPLAPGNATITATIPGYLQQGDAIRTVTVSP